MTVLMTTLMTKFKKRIKFDAINILMKEYIIKRVFTFIRRIFLIKNAFTTLLK